MAAAIDIYSSSLTSIFSDPLGEELMKALQPFMKISPSQSNSYPEFCSPSSTQMFSNGFSSHNQMGLEQAGSIGLNHLTPSQILQIQAEIQLQQQQQQQQIVAMASASLQNQRLSQWQRQNQRALDFLSPKAIPMKHHQGAHISGEFGDYKPLHSSVDAKLQAICQSLANSQKQGKTEEPCFVTDTKPAISASLDTNSVFDNSPKVELNSEIGYSGSEDCKVENSSSSMSPALSDVSSSLAGSSSPESDISFFDFSDSQCEETQNFGLEKYPSVEIDWAAIFKS
ncbi:hypothetical protein FH972_002684 [Carpinus fangiana]|uniref:Uncharacterized protein n=1 Tax=Carpinus fangiana TaxID=176857 RepID=A0A5N6QFL3_9ROSI|nr:hypothetical protein FH972_002684 [Carpinus fangiana]